MNRPLIPLLATIFLIPSCAKEDTNPVHSDPVTVPLPPEIVPSTRRALHGIWRNISGDSVIAFVVYDSVTSRLAEKRNYGYNFRSELASRAKVESDRILWGVGDGTYDP